MSQDNNKQLFYYVVFIFFSLLIAVSGYYYYRNFENRYITGFHNQLTAMAKMKISELGHWKKERFGDASVFFENQNFIMLVKSYLKSKGDPYLKSRIDEWLNKVKNAFDYDRVTLYNEKCEQLSFSASYGSVVSEQHIKKIFSTISKDKISFIDLFKLPESEKKYVGVFVPLHDQGNHDNLIGFLVFRVDAEIYLYKFLSEWPTENESAETLILRKENDSVLFLNNVRFHPESALKLKLPLSETDIPAVQAAYGHTGIVYGTDYRGQRVVAYVSAVPGFDWFMVSKIDVKEIYGPLSETALVLSAFVLSIILGGGVSLRYLWRRQRITFYMEKYESEKVLREKHELYKTLINHIPERILFKDTNSKYISCNNAHAEKLKISPDNIPGKSDFDFYSFELAERYVSEDKQIMNEHNLLVLEEETEEDGEKKWFLVTKTPVFEEKKRLIGILAIFEDITQRKKDEETLQKSLSQLKLNRERLESSQSIAHIFSWELDVVPENYGFHRKVLECTELSRWKTEKFLMRLFQNVLLSF